MLSVSETKVLLLQLNESLASFRKPFEGQAPSKGRKSRWIEIPHKYRAIHHTSIQLSKQMSFNL